MWEVRNKAVQKQYIDIGKSRETEFLKDKAKQHIEGIPADQDSDDEDLHHESKEVKKYEYIHIKSFFQNLGKLKRWIGENYFIIIFKNGRGNTKQLIETEKIREIKNKNMMVD